MSPWVCLVQLIEMKSGSLCAICFRSRIAVPLCIQTRANAFKWNETWKVFPTCLFSNLNSELSINLKMSRRSYNVVSQLLEWQLTTGCRSHFSKLKMKSGKNKICAIKLKVKRLGFFFSFNKMVLNQSKNLSKSFN